MVPGGQQMYVEPSGAVGFTQAHSASIPPGSFIGGFTYRRISGAAFDGIYGFAGWGETGFMACPTPGGHDHQVFANIGNATVPTGNVRDCIGFSALGLVYEGPIGAWQYV
jgi:hypothetical protein